MAATFARFEQSAYALRAEGQALTADRLNALSEAAVAKVWSDAVTDELGGARLHWASLPHFVHERFYTYPYTFAFLLATRLLARSGEPGFATRYERFLTAGGSASPEESLPSSASTSVTRRSGTTGSPSWRVWPSVCARGRGAPETRFEGLVRHRKRRTARHGL